MSSEKNFFKQIKSSLNKSDFIQKIENKYNSGFTDLIIINEKLPLFIELKAPIKGNRIKLEKSQISTHLRIFKNNYISFILVRDPLTSDLFLFDGGKLCTFISVHLCTPTLSASLPGYLDHGNLVRVLQTANWEARIRSQRK